MTGLADLAADMAGKAADGVAAVGRAFRGLLVLDPRTESGIATETDLLADEIAYDPEAVRRRLERGGPLP